MERAFKPLYGQPLNFVAFGKAVKKLDDWYQQRGILGQVCDNHNSNSNQKTDSVVP